MTVGDTECRVLVVEDEALIAWLITDTLESLGCDIVGPVSALEAALEMAQDPTVDAAILDVNVRGGKIYPVAELLLARGVPFVLASGYQEWALPTTLRDQPRLTKPYTMAQLEERVRLLCSEVARRRSAAGRALVADHDN